LKGDGTRAANKILRRSRYQGDMPNMSTPRPSSGLFPSCARAAAVAYWPRVRYTATPDGGDLSACSRWSRWGN